MELVLYSLDCNLSDQSQSPPVPGIFDEWKCRKCIDIADNFQSLFNATRETKELGVANRTDKAVSLAINCLAKGPIYHK